MKILYLGDNSGTSAEYLKDVLGDLEHSVNHIDGKENFSLAETYEAIIISDYPASKILPDQAADLKKQIESGTRLIMLGGWGSFNGRGKNYFEHPVADILPVVLQSADDRVNASQGLILKADASLESELDLDWLNPPIICGYNAVEAKSDAQTLVWASPIQTDGTKISLLEPVPMVVKGKAGQGTVIACMTDLAPHWAGGLVDWGSSRRQLPHVEVGDMYISFTRMLLEV